MKKILLKLSLLSLLSTYSFSATPAEIEQAKQMAQALAGMNANQNTQNTNQGESIFMTKDSTKNDFVGSSIRLQNSSSPQNVDYSSYPNMQQSSGTGGGELSDEQIALLKSAARNKNLRALQKTFLNKKYTGYENTSKYNFETDRTRKIRTRFAMATTLIFSSQVESYVIGDNTGFLVNEMPNLKNALAIKPMLIGIDTSLTVFTKDKKLHTFYIYSTDYKSKDNPNLVVYVEDEDSKNYEEAQKEKLKDYLVLEEGSAKLLIKKDEIYDRYKQKALRKNSFLMAEEIFNDKQFTYFKYNKERMPQLPTIFVVVDRQDSPIETRVIGNYIIVESTAKKFTIRLGESYVCVDRLEPVKLDENELIEKENNESINTDINELFKEVEPKTEYEVITKDLDETSSDEARNFFKPKARMKLWKKEYLYIL